jgi:formate-nitrite transporter family protein
MSKAAHPQKRTKPARQESPGAAAVTEREAEHVEERATPSTPVIYEVVRRMGEAVLCTYTPAVAPELKDAMLAVSGHLASHTWFEMVFRSVSAGFLVAAMVWLLSGAEGAQFPVITLMTYLIAAGGFMHIVAGSVEAFLLVLNGDMTWWWMAGGLFVPVLIGNVIGGTALFALIAYAQVMQEI